MQKERRKTTKETKKNARIISVECWDDIKSNLYCEKRVR